MLTGKENEILALLGSNPVEAIKKFIQNPKPDRDSGWATSYFGLLHFEHVDERTGRDFAMRATTVDLRAHEDEATQAIREKPMAFFCIDAVYHPCFQGDRINDAQCVAQFVFHKNTYWVPAEWVRCFLGNEQYLNDRSQRVFHWEKIEASKVPCFADFVPVQWVGEAALQSGVWDSKI